VNTYTVGTKVFCDFHFSGKPRGVVIEVLREGDGREFRADGVLPGCVRVRITETVGSYVKGQHIELEAWQAVPCKQEFKKRGSYFRWVNTAYRWVKPVLP